MAVITYNDSNTTYDEILVGYDGYAVTTSTEYYVIIRDFADTTNYAPGSVIAFIPSPHALGWATYINDVGEMFVSIAQDDPVLAKIASYVDSMPFIEIYRNEELVWRGYLGEIDETPDDVIIYGYSLEALLYWNVSGWNASYADGTSVQTIVDDALDAIIAATDSRAGWLTKGTIEAPVTTSDGSTALTMSGLKYFYKRWLTAFQELASYAISDTTNHVIFEITPSGTFNLWKDRNVPRSDLRFVYREGYIRNFRRVRKPVDRRFRILAVGSSPTDVTLLSTASDSGGNTIGMLTEPIFLSYVRDQTELDRIANARLQRAKQTDSDLSVTFRPNSLIPFRATGAQWWIGDDVTFELPRGISDTGSDTKIVTGQQVVYTRGTENVRLLLADAL